MSDNRNNPPSRSPSRWEEEVAAPLSSQERGRGIGLVPGIGLVSLLLAACGEGGGNSTDAGTDAGEDGGADGGAPDCDEGDTFDEADCPDAYPEWGCVVYVDGDAAASGDGWSWAGAVRTVQEGIDLAHCGAIVQGACDQYQVWVEAGTTYVHRGCREHTVRLREQVALYGGFTGVEAVLDDRDWEVNVTTLDGRDRPDGSQHVYHVVLGADDALIDGFTITEGLADGDNVTTTGSANGGGMWIEYASPTIRNCRFEGNAARYHGGGLRSHGGSVVIESSAFVGNTTIWEEGDVGGGGVMAWEGTITVTDCEFRDNHTGGWGGGLDVVYGTATVSGTTFQDNVASWGGGLDCYSASMTVTECTVAGNLAVPASGGGLFFYGCEASAIVDSVVSGNEAAGDGGGGWSGSSFLEINGCSFSENMATFSGGMEAMMNDSIVVDSEFVFNVGNTTGGAGFGDGSLMMDACLFEGNVTATEGGGMWVTASALVTNTVFRSNHGGTGGAVRVQGVNPVSLVGCTLTGNEAASGGAIWSENEALTVSGSILWGNTPYEIGHWPIGSSPGTVSYSLVQGGFPGEGNIDADPHFADAETGDFHLSPGSPCIDAADGTGLPEFDFDGNPRVDDPDSPNTGVGPPWADMGAFERQLDKTGGAP